jgi:enamine deaminase RidA (YjgF/YER057c/UK114 family)
VADIEIGNVEALGTPLGQYRHVTRVRASEFLFIAGMLSTDASGTIVGDGDFDAQCRQVFANIEAALGSAGAGWPNVVQSTTYLVHSQAIPQFMAFRSREFPRFFPTGDIRPTPCRSSAGWSARNSSSRCRRWRRSDRTALVEALAFRL